MHGKDNVWLHETGALLSWGSLAFPGNRNLDWLKRVFILTLDVLLN